MPLLLGGVVLVAVNLRAPVTSLGALLEEVIAELGISAALAGVVTMLPALSFAAFGMATPWLARRFPPARILVAAMVVLAAGQALRAATGSPAVFLVCTALALSGIAVANVLLPPLVAQRFPHRVGLVTGVYTMSLIFGTSAAAAVSVPIAQAAGSWRVGLGVWALLALVAALSWLPAAGSGRVNHRRPHLSGPVRPARTGLGWAMAIYFGTQALNAYALMGWLAQLFRDAGFAAAHAGLLLAAVTAIGIPVALVLPSLAVRAPDLRLVVLGLTAATATAYVGLAVAPGGAALLWVVLLAAGQAAFPLALTMIGMRARTPDGTVALSAFTQSAGYLIAGLGPLLVGVLYELTGGWTAPLAFLMAVLMVQTGAGLVIARPRHIEDALTPAVVAPVP
jgi:CP family cyanate transporter-like MFS transporter